MRHTPNRPLSHRIFSGSGWALFTMFVWELIEEGVESLIAFCVSEVFAVFLVKALSTLAIIGATQGIKVCIKRFLVPLIKTLTYKEGFDKMSKIKKFFTWLWCNKKTLLGVSALAVTELSMAEFICVADIPDLMIKGTNFTPSIYYGVLAIFILLGIFGVGIEPIAKFFERINLIKEQKQEKAISKEAKKELVAEEKKANQTQAEQEKAKAKEEAEKKAKAEKEKADAEHRAKVEQAKARLLAEQKNKA